MGKTLDVIIPVSGNVNRVPDTVKSIKDQSLKFDSLIIVTKSRKAEEKLKTVLPQEEGIVYTVAGSGYPGMLYNRALSLSKADFVLFVSPGAIPESCDAAAHMMEAFSDEKTAAVYANLVPSPHAKKTDQARQSFWFGERSLFYDLTAVGLFGMKAFMHSNIFAMYKREALRDIGPFENECISRTEYIWCAKAIYAGKRLLYDADARVNCSFSVNGMAAFRKSFDLGALQTMYAQVFGTANDPSMQPFIRKNGDVIPVFGPELKEMYQAQLKYALKTLNGIGSIPDRLKLRLTCFLEKRGAFLGKYYYRLPVKLIIRCSEKKAYWDSLKLVNR